MPALAPIPPWALKEMLTLYGSRILFEDECNWLLEDPNQPAAEPIVLPKLGELLAIDVMMDTLVNARTNTRVYLSLKEKVLGPG